MRLKVTVLGSGTSTGVPMPGCPCTVCQSGDPRNQRLRTSIFIAASLPGQAAPAHILVDTGPDFRQQMLREKISHLDAVLYTHAHADHVFGFDDLRCFNFIQRRRIPIYGSAPTIEELHRVFSYAFVPNKNYAGGALPAVEITQVENYKPFTAAGVTVLPLPLPHGGMEILGYRIGNFAYLTDCSGVPEEAMPHLQGLEILLLDGLRIRKHPTHLSHADAVEIAARLQPKRTFLTHVSHEVEHETANRELKKMTELPVEMAYDGLVVEVG